LSSFSAFNVVQNLTEKVKFLKIMNTKQLLGIRIKELRKSRNFSQQKLAEIVGIGPKHLSRIEVGKSFPSLETLEKLAIALDLELKDFFEFSHLLNTKKELKHSVIKLLEEAEDEKLRLIIKIIKAILV